MARTNGRYTVLFIPDNNGKQFSLRLHKNLLLFMGVIILIFLIGVVALLFGAGEIATKLQLASYLRTENERLKDKDRKLQKSLEQVEKIEQLTKYLQRLAVVTGEEAADFALQKDLTKSGQGLFAQDSIDNDIERLRLFNQEGAAAARAEALPQNYAASLPTIRPVDGWITQRFDTGGGSRPQHFGVDFAATKGSPILATAPGIVSDVVFDKYLGLLITLSHGYGYGTRYGHCLSVMVKKGDSVKRGQTIALVGNTGYSSAPHLHYEVLKDGVDVDPLRYFFNTQD
ncbi:MAG: M23 family metallopeptidase [Chitinivibrionales bacterium]|nr:M23 family metallopeptidase [Chitinivibrionales bacterium]